MSNSIVIARPERMAMGGFDEALSGVTATGIGAAAMTLPMARELARQIIENPMLNGEAIRRDGALRMAPK